MLYRKKLIHKWVRLPRPKRDLDTQTTYGPQTWQRGRYAQWSIHPLSLAMTRACPVRRGLVAAVTCCVRKTRFVLLPGQVLEQKKNEPEPCVDFSTTRANPVWFSVFRSHDCRPEFQKHPRSTQTDQQQRNNSSELHIGSCTHYT